MVLQLLRASYLAKQMPLDRDLVTWDTYTQGKQDAEDGSNVIATSESQAESEATIDAQQSSTSRTAIPAVWRYAGDDAFSQGRWGPGRNSTPHSGRSRCNQ